MARVRAKSRIDGVTVYSDRVMVRRSIQVNLKGSVEIVVPDLPGALDDNTVRTKAKGLRVGEVMVKTGYHEEKHPDVARLDTKIEKFAIEDRTLADEILVLQDKEKFLTAITVAAPKVISKELHAGKISTQSWRQGLKFVSDNLLGAKKRAAEIERRRSEIKKKSDALKHELNDIQAVMQNKKTVIFDAHVLRAGKYQIELSYIIYGASWRTYYELRANLSLGKIDLAYYGKIVQRTGEDWLNTRLTLSTAQPAAGGNAPEPYPWYIEMYMPDEDGRRDRLVAAEAPASSKAEAKRALPRDKEAAATAPPIDTGIAITYPLPGRHSIKSGEPERKVKIVDRLLVSDFEYFIIPRFAELAYLTGAFKNTSNYLFISGDAHTFVGDDFTGQGYLETVAPEEKSKVSFGVDERVKVERKARKYKVSRSGLMKKITKYEFAYENNVTNLHNRPIRCTIVDQIPVSRSADLKVSDVEISPKPSKQEKGQGIFTWETPIDAGKQVTIRIAFCVEAPADADVEGLS